MITSHASWVTLRDTVRRNGPLVALIIVLGFVSATLEGLGIGLVIPLLSIIVGPDGAEGASGLSALFSGIGAGLDPGTRLVAISAVIFALILMKNAVGFANGVISGYVYGKASHAIRIQLAERLLRVGFPFLQKQDPGRLLNIISNESWRVSDAIQTTLSMIVSASCALVLTIFLLLLSWQMTLSVALGLVAIQAIHALVTARVKAPSRALTARNNTMAARMLHVVHSGQLIRIFRQEERERDAFARTSDDLRHAAFVLHRRLSVLPVLTEVMFAGLFLTLVVSAWLANVSFPVIATFVVLLYRLQPYVRGLQGAWGQLRGWSGSIEAVQWLLDPAGKPEAPGGTQDVGPITERIAFRDVRFGYGGETGGDGLVPVLRGVSFDLKAGRSTALVGRSGAGKTTIISLLCRLIEPDRGTILVDDKPLSTIDPAAWRSRIAVASQELELIDGTIADNITYGKPGATRAEAMAAAHLSEAAEFIEATPEGYDTLIGYRGVNLSAGQRQRIALARALLLDPDLLILDEATNAIDGLSEAAILDTLRARSGRKTTVVISHHRKTLSSCDDVILLRDGRVVDELPLERVATLDMEALYDLGADEACD
ncbi:ABC transporter ATP-binding protein [Acuticoccus sediminis]|uniref:ABC transporter ATP-binding protein n=1 Tax=Acuticoccus sediminis TaxID=2184697 RepID=UPI00192E59D6|nr:ABC transporter ATP-binding protein [Acuticoccus sediminis]